jgi:hypothetical protein
MERERAFHFPHRLGRDVRDDRRHDAALDPVKSEQPPNGVVDRISDARGLRVGREAGELGDVIQRMCVHGQRWRNWRATCDLYASGA